MNLKVIFIYGIPSGMESSSSAEIASHTMRSLGKYGLPLRIPIALLTVFAAVACSDSGSSSSGADAHSRGADDSGLNSLSASGPVDVPIPGVGPDWEADFNTGDTLFDLIAREADGLGPLYTRQACSSCHAGALRGAGLVEKMAVVLDDGLTPSPDQSALPYGHTVHRFMAAGTTTPILAPSDPKVRVTLRLGPPVLGRGYLEAVADSEISNAAEAQASLAGTIHGRVNWVTYASEANPDKRFHDLRKGDAVIGRFGLKARIATLDDFVADALQLDMGLTSPLRPTEFPNPDGLTEDLKPGVDTAVESVNHRANYTRLLAIPDRKLPNGNGAALFAQVQCSSCHVPSMHTRADYPIVALADIDAPVYTDLLLHDMGDNLSDSLSGTDGQAGPRDWRTAPLIGLRFLKNYLHDGRATTIRDAVLMHDGNGSESRESIQSFLSLSNADQDALLDFVGAL